MRRVAPTGVDAVQQTYNACTVDAVQHISATSIINAKVCGGEEALCRFLERAVRAHVL